MTAQPIEDRLAVCSWSLHPADPAELIAKLQQIGISKIQLALDPLREGGAWADAKQQLADGGITIVGGMMGCVGEDYATLDAIRRTGGVVPDETWPQTWENIQAMAPIAKDLGVDYVTFHAGFLPEEPDDPNYDKLVGRLGQVADLYAALDITLGFETGQEEGPTLLGFLQRLAKPNVGVNFDPANIILYDKGDPIDALKVLVPYAKQCHIKDATKTSTTGEWGAEVVVGTGEMNWPAFFSVLAEAGFDGPLAIEREAGDDRVGDIGKAREHVLTIL